MNQVQGPVARSSHSHGCGPDQAEQVLQLAQVLETRAATATEVERVLGLAPEALRLWREAALVDSVVYARDHSAFYRSHLGDRARELIESRNVEALKHLPFTTRQDLMDQYPFGFLATPRRNLVRFGESSGTTTGKSIAAYFTARDWITNNCTVAHFLRRVLSPQDLVAVAVPYELAGVGQDLDRSLEVMGCCVVALGALTPFCPPERMVKIMRDAGVTTLICSGTRALYLAEVARASGLDPRTDFRVDKILFAGEGASPAKRKKLSEVWGAKVYAMYGMTETNTLGMFCPENELHLVENRSWFEVVDPESGTPVPEGEVGELVVTSLNCEAMPLVRYRTGDMCRIGSQPTRCGGAFRTLRHLGRTTDRLQIDGRFISQMELENVIMSHLTAAPYYFCFGEAQGRLKVGLTANNMNARTRQAIRDELRERHGISARFSVIEEESFAHSIRSAVKPTMRSFMFD